MKFSGFVRTNQKQPIYFAALWSLGGLLAIFVPLITWSVTKGHYYDRFGKYQAMQQQGDMQAEYEEYAQNKQQNENNQYWDNMYQVANYYNQGGAGQGEEEREGEGGQRLLEDQAAKYYYHSRYQYAQQQQQEGGQQQQQRGGYYANREQQQQSNIVKSPSWYNMLGGKQSTYYGGTTSSPATAFVYAWSLALFVALVAYGAYAIYSKHPVTLLCIALLVHLQYTLLLLLLLPQGVLSTPTANDTVSDPYAFYNSASMLMVYTYYSQILFGILAFVFGGIKIALEKILLGTSPALGETEAEEPVDIEDGIGKDYSKFDKLVIQ